MLIVQTSSFGQVLILNLSLKNFKLIFSKDKPQVIEYLFQKSLYTNFFKSN